MNTMHKIAAMMALYGLAISSNTGEIRSYRENPTEEELEYYKQQIEKKKRELLLKQGMKEFVYPECIIIALNKKNADRKYKNFINLIKTSK